jgi:hypothetical protein
MVAFWPVESLPAINNSRSVTIVGLPGLYLIRQGDWPLSVNQKKFKKFGRDGLLNQ